MFSPNRRPLFSPACHRAAAWAGFLCLATATTARAQPHNDFSHASSAFNQSNTTFNTQQPKVMLGPTFGGTITTNGQPATGSNVSQSVGGRKMLDSQFNTSGPDMSAAGFSQNWNGDGNSGPNLNGIQAVMGRNDSTYSSFNGKEVSSQFKAAFPQGPNMELKMMPNMDTRRPTMAPQNDKMSALNNFTSPNEQWAKNTGPSKFSDAVVMQAHLFPDYDQMGSQGAQMQSLGRELSMQDINRYQFSGSHSSEPGLPVTKAGGNLNSSSAGVLSTGPALFDSWASTPSPTSQVHSGSAVSPHMMAPGLGNSLMSPSQNASSDSYSGPFTPNAVLQKGDVSLPVQLGPRRVVIPKRPGVTVDPQP